MEFVPQQTAPCMKYQIAWNGIVKTIQRKAHFLRTSPTCAEPRPKHHSSLTLKEKQNFRNFLILMHMMVVTVERRQWNCWYPNMKTEVETLPFKAGSTHR